MSDALLTIDGAADLLHCSTKSIRRHVHAGRLPAMRGPGGRLLFEQQALRDSLRPAVSDVADLHETNQSAASTVLAAMASDLTTLNA